MEVLPWMKKVGTLLNGLWERPIYHNWDLFAFRIVAWLVVVGSLVAIGTKLFLGRPAATPTHYLLGIAMVAALLPAALSGLLPLVRKIKLKEVEIELSADVDTAIKQLNIPDAWPLSVTDTDNQSSDYPADLPYPVVKLSKAQKYHYERFSHKLYQLLDVIKDPNDLHPEIRNKYRGLIRNVGLAAIAMDHATKAADIISRLLIFGKTNLDANELHLLGRAHLWAARETTSQTECQVHWKEAMPFLEAASKLNPHEPRIFFNLGWTCLMVGNYETGISMMETAIKLDPYVTPWAKWNISCGKVKLGRKQAAITTLEEIDEGPWWDYINRDDWFADLRNDGTYKDRFELLIRIRMKGAMLVKQ